MAMARSESDPVKLNLHQLETGLRELRRVLRIMDRTGQPYTPACRDLLLFIAREAREARRLQKQASHDR
jgi:hypothetical protein